MKIYIISYTILYRVENGVKNLKKGKKDIYQFELKDIKIAYKSQIFSNFKLTTKTFLNLTIKLKNLIKRTTKQFQTIV